MDTRHPAEGSAPHLNPREGAWFAKPRRVRWGLRRLPGFVVCVWTPYYVGTIASKLAGWEMPAWITWAFLLLTTAYLLGSILRLAWEFAARRRRAIDARLSDHIPGLREYPVEVVVSEDGLALGMDRGVLWFDDGLLGFSGEATSFLISGEDVVARDSASGKTLYEKPAKDEILLARAGLFSTIRLMPVMGLHRFAYRRALRRFLQERRPVEGLRQWPPAARYGERPTLRPTLEDTAGAMGAEAARTGFSRGVLRTKR